MSKLLTIHQIRGLRIGNKIAQKDFAELMGMPASSWSNVEHGNNKFQPWMQEKATRLMQELGLYRPDRVQENAVEVVEVEEMPVIQVPQEDNVNHPSHYASRKYEVIDVMEDTMSGLQFQGYLLGCTLKYIMRWDKKDAPIQDLEKAQWYLNRLIQTLKQHEQGE